MVRIKDLLAEIEIRFGVNWENQLILENGYPFGIKFLNKGICNTGISSSEVWNTNGIIYESGQWATADIKTAPEKWVVEKDESNPLWKVFMKCSDSPVSFFDSSDGLYYIEGGRSASLLSFKGYQYLTLQQWYDLIYLPELNKPKVGDWGIFYNNINEAIIKITRGRVRVYQLTEIDDDGLFRGGVNGLQWYRFFKIDITKPLPEELNRFLEFAGSDYRL